MSPRAEALTEYRLLRHAQDDRYENATGLPVGETWRQEYRDYFGVGDCGTAPVERRWTFRRFLTEGRRGPVPDYPDTDTVGVAITAESARALWASDLAALAAAGDTTAAAELVRRQARRAGPVSKRRGRVRGSTVRAVAA